MLSVPPAYSQRPGRSAELSEAEVQAVGNDVLARLEHVNEFLRDQQWDDAVETLRRVMENGNDRLLRLPASDQNAAPLFRTYVPVGEYCQMQLASWHFEAPEALAIYRQRVDGAAAQWFEEANRERDEAKLLRIVDGMMLSSSGDEGAPSSWRHRSGARTLHDGAPLVGTNQSGAAYACGCREVAGVPRGNAMVAATSPVPP